MSEDGHSGRTVLRIAGPDDAVASGQGIGTGLLKEATRWAAARGLRRIELNVMAHNHRAIALYERAGFVREGRRVACLLIDGTFFDELYMAMVLPESLPS